MSGSQHLKNVWKPWLPYGSRLYLVVPGIKLSAYGEREVGGAPGKFWWYAAASTIVRAHQQILHPFHIGKLPGFASREGKCIDNSIKCRQAVSSFKVSCRSRPRGFSAPMKPSPRNDPYSSIPRDLSTAFRFDNKH